MAPEDKRYGQDVLIPSNATGAAKPGQVVVVELTEAPALFGQPVGRIIEVLGEVDDPGMEIEIAVRKYGVPHIFSDACLEQAKALPEKVRPADYRHRIDLTDILWLPLTVKMRATLTMPCIASPPRWGAARAGACLLRLPT